MIKLVRVGIITAVMISSRPLYSQVNSPDSLSTIRNVDSVATQQPTLLTGRRNLVKANPLSLVAGQISVFYERSLSPRLSVVVGYGRGGNSSSFGTHLPNGGVIYQRGTLELRRYWSKKSLLSGFYVGPYLRLSRLSVKNFVYDQQQMAIKDSQGDFVIINKQAFVWIPGVLVGHQIIARRFCFDAFFGVQGQLVTNDLDNSNQFTEGMTKSVAVRIGLSMGMTF